MTLEPSSIEKEKKKKNTSEKQTDPIFDLA